MLLGAVGSDYFDGRNLIPVFVPLIILIAAGFGARRAGRAGLALAGAFCLCSLVFTLEVDRLPRLQREDFRNVAAALGPARPGRAIVTIRYAGNMPLEYYLGARPPRGPLPPLREIDLVGSESAAAKNAHRILPPAFHRVESRPVSYNFTLTRYRAARPVRVPLRVLGHGALVGGGARSAVLVGGGSSP